MTATLPTEILQDELTISLARAFFGANKRARESGIDPDESVVMIDQEFDNGQTYWRITYGPKGTVNQRGGDFIVDVDAEGTVLRTLFGQ